LNRLLIITGPTASGKTAEAIRLARDRGTEILSCDSRQFYREMRIGVARPSDDELAAAPHHFIACRSVTEPYNISDYERDAMKIVNRLFAEGHDTVIAVGGSGLYVDALRLGVTSMPDPTPELRARLQQMSLEEKRSQLQLLDPDYYARVDLRNPVRLQRALEVCYMTGRPYSQVLADHQPVPRPFSIEVRVVQMPADELRRRIDRRVDQMLADGLLDEVRTLLPYRHLNILNTVGYRELFPVLDGTKNLADAVAEIKLNTWHYARKQMTWCRRYIS
jgi:tRNA dimethylallyltransferase